MTARLTYQKTFDTQPPLPQPAPEKWASGMVASPNYIGNELKITPAIETQQILGLIIERD